MRFFFASRLSSLTRITISDKISFWPHIVYNLNLYHKDTLETWKNEDLDKDYLLTPTISFKKGRIPKGIPYIYEGSIDIDNIYHDKDFPYLFRSKFPTKIEKLTKKESHTLIYLSRSLYKNFNLVM